MRINITFLKTLYHYFNQEDCTYRAAALTYTTLLSLVPLIAVSFAIFSYFPAYQTAALHVQDFILKHFVASSGEVIQQYLQQFIERTMHISIIGFMSLLITALLMVYNVEVAFNALWKVKKNRKLIPRILLYLSVIILGPILLVTSVIISAYIKLIPFVSLILHQSWLVKLLFILQPLIFSIVSFTLLYYVIPNHKVPLRNAFIASIIASLLFELSKKGFNIYLHYFASYDLFYGALAAIPVFLLWIYIMWIIILVGVMISYLLTTDMIVKYSKD